MRRGVLLSFLLHSVVLALLVFHIPNFLPEPEVKAIKVKLVAAPDVKKTITPQRKVRSQQSSAPAAAPAPEKVQPKPKSKPKHKTVVKSPKKVVQKQEKKPQDPAPEKAPPKKPKPEVARPEKLDKTPNKKNVIKSDDPAAQPAMEDDFLAALDFIEDLKSQNSALTQAKQATAPTTLDEASQADIAIITSHIERNWYLPPGIKGADNLYAIIEVKVTRDGLIDNLRVLRSSGEVFYDNSLLRAVRKSVPFPIPPEKYKLFNTLELRFGKAQ